MGRFRKKPRYQFVNKMFICVDMEVETLHSMNSKL